MKIEIASNNARAPRLGEIIHYVPKNGKGEIPGSVNSARNGIRVNIFLFAHEGIQRFENAVMIPYDAKRSAVLAFRR